MSNPRRMSAHDASFLYYERSETPLHLGAAWLMDGPLPAALLAERMRRRLHRIPRYRQVARADALGIAHFAWEDDAAFDVQSHLEEVVLQRGATRAEMLSAVAAMHSRPIDRRKPLWRMGLIHWGDRTVVVSLVHQAMVDGVSGMEILNTITDLQRDASDDDELPWTPEQTRDDFDRVREAAWDTTQGVVERTASEVLRALDPAQRARDWSAMVRTIAAAAPGFIQPAAILPFNKLVGSERSVATFTTPFSAVRRVREQLGGTANDVVLTALSGGLRTYLSQSGERYEGVTVRAMVPVNLRHDDKQDNGGNRVSMILSVLPVGVSSATERHLAIVGEMATLRGAGQASWIERLGTLAELVPPAAQAAIGALVPGTMLPFNIVCTNVPGPQIPLYLCGRQVEEFVPLVPLSHGLGLNVALASYNGTLSWGICADPQLANAERFANAVEAAFDELARAGAEAERRMRLFQLSTVSENPSRS